MYVCMKNEQVNGNTQLFKTNVCVCMFLFVKYVKKYFPFCKNKNKKKGFKHTVQGLYGKKKI